VKTNLKPSELDRLKSKHAQIQNENKLKFLSIDIKPLVSIYWIRVG